MATENLIKTLQEAATFATPGNVNRIKSTSLNVPLQIKK